MILPWLLAGCLSAPVPEPPPASPWMAAVDWAAATEDAAQLLSSYLAIDTSNPPGNEARPPATVLSGQCRP